MYKFKQFSGFIPPDPRLREREGEETRDGGMEGRMTEGSSSPPWNPGSATRRNTNNYR